VQVTIDINLMGSLKGARFTTSNQVYDGDSKNGWTSFTISVTFSKSLEAEGRGEG
jgi:hypothetical protein